MNEVVRHPFVDIVIGMLEEYGGLYTFPDIIGGIETGQYQSWVAGDSWCVTQILVFPQKKVVDVMFVVGDLAGVDKLQGEVEEWAEDIGADMLMSSGRPGWKKEAEKHGWRPTLTTFVKDL